MRDAILDERGWELYHEGYRREDLVRHGKLLEKVNEKYHYYFGKDMPWKNNNDRILQPIPTNALLLNPLLKQNPELRLFCLAISYMWKQRVEKL